MAIVTSRWRDAASQWRRPALSFRVRVRRSLRLFFGHYRFSSITGRIIVLNLFGVAILVSGIFYLDQGRVRFTQTRVESISAQAAIIASAIGQIAATQSDITKYANPQSDSEVASPLLNPDLSSLSFQINPADVVPILNDLVAPTKTRAFIYDTEGNLVVDSQKLKWRGPKPDAPPLDQEDFITDIWTYINTALSDPGLPIYRELGEDGKSFDEVRLALAGTQVPQVRLTQSGGTVISVAMPIKRAKTVLGALVLVTQGSDIDEAIAGERWQVVQLAGLAVLVTGILAWLLAGTIAGPMRRLALAAERVRVNIKTREKIPDYTHRADEIGYLSRALIDMTNALYLRLDAIESFAADVAHELKNPLTSLRNAAGMLRQIKADADREKLISIIHHDVRRLDRLITDISDASRLDVELARETAEPVNLARLLATLCDVTRDTRAGSAVDIILRVEGCSSVAELNSTENYMTDGHDSRLSQVIVNLLDNAISFSPKGGKIFVSARRIEEDGEFEITVEDEGPGIPPDNLTKIFARFYTDRPESQGFGQNSGLGLNISEQIVKAHGGRIWAENRTSLEPVELAEKARGKGRKKRAEAVDALERASQGAAKTFGPRPSYGARFVIRLPFCAKGQSC